jgi:cysteinyl-tRNA synthetase
MVLKLFNTLTREKEDFKPEKEETTFYACGPTVYHYAHLGNLRAYVFADILRKTLKYNGHKVKEVINITDVGHLTSDADAGEDKMEKGAKREGKTVWDVAEYYTQAFKKDIKALNIEEPEIWAKATDHIKEQWAMVQSIADNGYAYFTSDGIYFDTAKLADYGKLVPNFNAKQLAAGHRIEMGDKKNPTDFALWKFSPENEERAMQWTTTMKAQLSEKELAQLEKTSSVTVKQA